MTLSQETLIPIQSYCEHNIVRHMLSRLFVLDKRIIYLEREYGTFGDLILLFPGFLGSYVKLKREPKSKSEQCYEEFIFGGVLHCFALEMKA